jgi:signal transduction histidine kinase
MKWIATVLALCLSTLLLGQSKEDLQQKLKKATADTTTVRLYGKLSRFYMTTQPDSATFYIGKGLNIARKINDRLGEGLMLSLLGSIHEIHGNLELAEKYDLEAVAIFEEIGDKKAIAQGKNGLGVIEGKKGNYAKATTYFLEALELHKAVNNVPGVVQCYIKLGTVNDFNRNFKMALDYYNKAMELNKNDTTNNAYFTLLNNLGIIYAKTGDMKKALSYFEKGLPGSNNPKFIDIHIDLLNSAMKASAILGYRAKAIDYHNKAISKARDYDLPDDEARALINYADELLGDNTALAIDYYNKALPLLNRAGNREFAAEVNFGLSLLHKKLGNFQLAYTALEQYQKIHDSLFNINKTRELASLFASYELNESKSKIKELELNNEKTIAERNLVIGCISAIMLILFILWFYYRKTEKLNAQLRETNLVKDKIFSIIGHDLKTPVNGLVQTLDLLDTGIIDEDQRKFIISTLKKQTAHTYDTLDALLRWGQAQLQGVTVNLQPIQPKEIIKRNIDMLQKQADEKFITIQDNTNEAITVMADANHIEFIVRNLLSNAIKFTDTNGSIEISATNSPSAKEIIFSIKDNGKGISKEQVEKFASSNIKVAYGTKGEKGTGLGLLLTKEFIKANKGKIWLESKEGKGTTFFFQLNIA